MHEPYDIIDTVRLTEKATLLAEKHNQYVFRVAKHANKLQIKHAVEKLFGKKVSRVNTCNYAGKKGANGPPLSAASRTGKKRSSP